MKVRRVKRKSRKNASAVENTKDGRHPGTPP